MYLPLRTLGTFALIILIAAWQSTPAVAQSTVTGRIVDAVERSPLAGVNVVATRLTPDSTRTGVATDSEGRFRLRLAEGAYRMRFTFIGFERVTRTVQVEGEALDLGVVAMRPDIVALGEAVVEATQDRVTVRGDTTVFNADAYTVTPNANAEDLIRKMPGVVVEDGNVQAQGEQVRRVLVDGEEFFGDDPTAALRNLPSEIIQEIEVYDRESDQARFTGFQDGEEERTINIVTRPGMRNGQFGRVFGGYGSDNRYAGGAAINIFDGTRRFTILGLTNNINQQNFSTEDLLGVLGDGGGRRGGGGPRGGGPPGGGGFRGGGGMSANPRNYLVGERGGLNTTNSFGLNYTDRWDGDIRVNGSYFFNRTGNETENLLEREYLISEADNQLYFETNDSEGANANHRLNFRLEAPLTEATQITITPRLSLQTNASESVMYGRSAVAGGTPISQFDNRSTADDLAYSASTNLLLRHRFPTRGRTISANIGLDMDGQSGDSHQELDYLYYEETGARLDSTDSYSRDIDSEGRGRGVSANLAYTEPVGERSVLQINYRPSVSRSTSDQEGLRLDPETGAYTIVDSLYTSFSNRDIVRQRGGVTYRYQSERVRGSVGVDLQNEQLQYDQAGPRPFAIERSYFSVLPSANLRLNLSEGSNLNLSYRPSTSAPGVNQLRDQVDDSNPLLVTSGNPDLRPSASHRLIGRFRMTRPGAGSSFMGFLNFTTTQNYIGNAVAIAGRDTLQVRGVTIEPGARYSYPVNLDGYWSARSYFTYGSPISLLRSNLNVSTGVSYSSTPSLNRGMVNRADALQLDGRFFLGSNISEDVDFSLSYGLGYSTVANTSATANDNSSLRHRGDVRMSVIPWKRLVLESNLSVSHYTGLAAGVDPTSAMLNGSIGYRFLGSERAEVRLTVNDILNQNTSVSRNVTDTYVEDRQTQALGRHVMLNLIYHVRHFGSR